MLSTLPLDELDLHDTVLRWVELRWEEKTCHLHLRVKGAPRVLRFMGVSRFRLSHEEPWGPSLCVNQARGSSLKGFEIEMQSGDAIEIAARGFDEYPE